RGLEKLRGELRALSQQIKEDEKRLTAVEDELSSLLLMVPNVPDPSVPVGTSEADNVVVRTWGEAPRFPFTPRQHFEIGERLGLLDFERAAKVSGSRFAFYRGDLARLERALVTFMIDLHTARGYTELLPPYLVSRAAMTTPGPAPNVRGGRFQARRPGRAVPHPHRRGPGHQLPRRRDPRRRAPPLPLRCLQPLLPRRGRSGRQGHPRPHPPASVP